MDMRRRKMNTTGKQRATVEFDRGSAVVAVFGRPIASHGWHVGLSRGY